MTRINVVPVTELCDKHLLAEYRELPRVFRLARPCPDAPKKYTLGAGHVKFFYDKLAYLSCRFRVLAAEAQKRGFTVKYTEPPFREDCVELYGDYCPPMEALEINRARIAERISQFKRR